MTSHWIHLASAVVLRVSGRDARRYLNNRLTNDLRTLRVGELTEAAALNPQGRVEGLFTVFVEGDESLLLVCDGGKRNTILAAVSRYIVADRVSIEDISSGIMLIHSCNAELVTTWAKLLYSYPRARIGSSGSDCLLSATESGDVLEACAQQFGPPLSTAEYDLLRWRRGFVVYPDEINEDIILTEGGLRSAVSFTKGCYVGQEVIERSDAIGKLPRKIERIVLDGIGHDLVRAQVLSGSGHAIGKVVSSVLDTERSLTCVFALLRNGAYAAGESAMCGALSGRILGNHEVIL